MALATISDVEARLGRSLTVAETSKANAYLADATALFIQRAVQKFEVGESTVRLFPRDGVVRLVQRPVISLLAMCETLTVWTLTTPGMAARAFMT